LAKAEQQLHTSSLDHNLTIMPPLIEVNFAEAPFLDLTNHQRELFFDARERDDDNDGVVAVSRKPRYPKNYQKKHSYGNYNPCQEKPRKVSFASFHEVKECIHKNEYTPKEKSRSFYSAKEFKMLRHERHECLRLMQDSAAGVNNGHFLFSFLKGPSSSVCTRGLENKTFNGSRRRLLNITQAVDAVLEEQERQISQFGALRDVESLSRAYRHVSAYCSCEAQVRGKSDFEAVHNNKKHSTKRR
jgi:hypothetical protein